MIFRSDFTLTAQTQIQALEPRLRVLCVSAFSACEDPEFYGRPSVSPPYPPGYLMTTSPIPHATICCVSSLTTLMAKMI